MHFSTVLSSTFVGAALAVHPGQLPFGLFDSLAFQPAYAPSHAGLRARDLDGLAEEEFSLYAREAKGSSGGHSSSSRPSAAHVAQGISDGAGNFGTALTGISNFVNLFKSQHKKRDLEDLENLGLEIVARDIEDGSIYVRAAKGASSGGSRRPSLSAIGHGANTALNGAGNIGTALTGVSDFVNLFKGGKRDLEDLEYEILARDQELDME